MRRIVIAIVLASCAKPTTYSTAIPPSAVVVRRPPSQYGTVESVHEVVHHVRGDVVSGLIASVLIGAVVFGGDAARLLLLGGAAARGDQVSAGSYETQTYEIAIRLDDGSRSVYTRDNTSLRPGDRVALAQDGPHRLTTAF
jgi:outer membrane lipoprotein SlyB